MQKNRAFFLDRDGVINRAMVKNGKPYPPQTLAEFEILPEVTEALENLRKEGYLLIVVTNQPDVARGTQKREIVEAMHALLLKKLPLDGIEVCYDEKSGHYKPQPGMIFESAEKYNIDLSSSFMVGDRWRDVGAGKAAGCFTIFIDNKYEEKLTEKPDLICSSLKEAVTTILKKGIC